MLCGRTADNCRGCIAAAQCIAMRVFGFQHPLAEQRFSVRLNPQLSIYTACRRRRQHSKAVTTSPSSLDIRVASIASRSIPRVRQHGAQSTADACAATLTHGLRQAHVACSSCICKFMCRLQCACWWPQWQTVRTAGRVTRMQSTSDACLPVTAGQLHPAAQHLRRRRPAPRWSPAALHPRHSPPRRPRSLSRQQTWLLRMAMRQIHAYAACSRQQHTQLSADAEFVHSSQKGSWS